MMTGLLNQEWLDVGHFFCMIIVVYVIMRRRWDFSYGSSSFFLCGERSYAPKKGTSEKKWCAHLYRSTCQAGCDTPIARIAGCVSSLSI